MEDTLGANSEHTDTDAGPIDPPMSSYERRILASLRRTLGWPYSVFKVRDSIVNDAKLSWNPDFWVEKRGKKILVVRVLSPDTTLANLDLRMRDAFATMSLNHIYHKRIALSAPHGVLILPDAVSFLPNDNYSAYAQAFDEIGCEIIAEKDIGELELYKDDEDRHAKVAN